MHLDEIYASNSRRETVHKTMEMMQRLNRNKRVTLEREKEEEQREIDRENHILNAKLEGINKGQYVRQNLP